MVLRPAGALDDSPRCWVIAPLPHLDDGYGLRVKMCVWLGVSRGLDLAFLNAD